MGSPCHGPARSSRQIIIKVVEREPVGLARIRGEIFQFDVEAELLDPDPRAAINFPILDGLEVDER